MVIVMDVCQGSLASLVGKNWLKTHGSEAQRLMLEVALGIQHMHESSVAHRDIKPENILLKDGHAKVSDYGLSKVITSFAATKAGTPLYLAPELLFSNSYGLGVDIWSLGLVFLELLLDKRIYEVLQGAELPARRNDFPTRQLIATLPTNAARSLIVAMLKRDPKERPDIKAVVQFLMKNDLYNEKEVEAQNNNGGKTDLYMIGTDGGVYLVAVQNGEVTVLGMAPNQQQPERVQNAPTLPKPKRLPSPAPAPKQNLYPPPPPPAYKPNPRPQPPPQQQRRVPANRDIVIDINNPLIETCPHCDANTQSISEHRSGWVFWGWCLLLCVTVPPLMCVPLCVDKCKDEDRYCAECGYLKREINAKCC